MHHSLTGPNSLSPATMTADARLSELGRIVAAGVLRLRHKSSSIPSASGDSSLAISPAKSVSRLRVRARMEDDDEG